MVKITDFSVSVKVKTLCSDCKINHTPGTDFLFNMERNEYITKLVQDGLNPMEIANKLNFHRSTVYEILNELNLKPHHGNAYKWSENETKILIDALCLSKTVTEIKKLLPQRSRSAIAERIRDLNFYHKNNIYRQWLEDDKYELQELIWTGYLHSEIAKKLCRTRQSVTAEARRQKFEVIEEWTSKHDKLLIEKVNEGKSIKQVALELNQKKRAIAYRAEKLGLTFKLGWLYLVN